MSPGLVVALVGLTSLALAILLVPLLLRQRRAAARDDYDLAVYRDQLAEVERDAGCGLLDAEQAEAARTEIARRILALRPAAAAVDGGPVPLAAAAVAVLLVPLAAWAIYWQLGSPALPDQPFAERPAAPGAAAPTAGHIDMNEAVGRLAAQLRAHPDDLTGWLLLARSELSLGHYQKAAEAYRHAVDLSGRRPEILGDWGEAQVLAAGGPRSSAIGAKPRCWRPAVR
jgi:cytochrome c-type biogenesis protein CcmH